MNKSEYVQTILACPVELLESVIDDSTAQWLFSEYVGSGLLSKCDMLRAVKDTVSYVDWANKEFPKIGVTDTDLYQLVSDSALEQICSKYHHRLICIIYGHVCERKPHQSLDTLELAKAVKDKLCPVRKDVADMSVDELKSTYSKAQLISIWEGLFGMKCRKRTVDDIAWSIWEFYSDAKRTADLCKNLVIFNN